MSYFTWCLRHIYHVQCPPGAEFPIQLVGRLPHQLWPLPHQLYGLSHQFLIDFGAFRFQNDHVDPEVILTNPWYHLKFSDIEKTDFHNACTKIIIQHHCLPHQLCQSSSTQWCPRNVVITGLQYGTIFDWINLIVIWFAIDREMSLIRKCRFAWNPASKKIPCFVFVFVFIDYHITTITTTGWGPLMVVVDN